MSIGSRLKEARISKKITQTDLASAIGVTKGAIGNYETDVSSPKEDILIRLMKYLDIDANYLYQDYMSTADGALTFQFSDDEYRLVDLYRGADDRAKRDAIRILKANQQKNTSQSAI